MYFIPLTEFDTLIANGKQQAAAIATGEPEIDFKPVLRYFTPQGNATWLLTEVLPEDPFTAFGLCDLGVGVPELGCVSLIALGDSIGTGGLDVVPDRRFKAIRTLSQYAEAARFAGRIVL